jgi:hypothetical protein
MRIILGLLLLALGGLCAYIAFMGAGGYDGNFRFERLTRGDELLPALGAIAFDMLGLTVLLTRKRTPATSN